MCNHPIGLFGLDARQLVCRANHFIEALTRPSTGTHKMTTNPQELARKDWAESGEFAPEKLQDEQRREYEAEAARIERQWDNQPN